MARPITTLQTLDSDWAPHKFIEVNFSKLTDSNQIFRIDFVHIHYHLCEISTQIIEFKIFAPYDFLEMNSLVRTAQLFAGIVVQLIGNAREFNCTANMLFLRVNFITENEILKAIQ